MGAFDIDSIAGSLQAVRQQWRDGQRRALEPGGRDLPSRDALAAAIDALKGALFPMRLGPPDLRQESENFYVAHALDAALHGLLAQARLELHYAARRERAAVIFISHDTLSTGETYRLVDVLSSQR